MDYSLSEDERKRFKEDGFIGPFELHTPEEMTRIWAATRKQLATDKSLAIYSDAMDSNNLANNIASYDRHFDVQSLAQHICNPKIVQKVSSLIGPDVLCWRTEFFFKTAGDAGTDWHQANTFANASGRKQIEWPAEEGLEHNEGTITVWTAFTEATERNGCLRVMPGTHKERFYDETKSMNYRPDDEQIKDGVKRGFFGYDYRELQRDPNWTPDESKAISITLNPGQFVIFWSSLMHASLPHTGTRQEQRMGFVGRYAPTKVRVYPDTQFVEEYGGRISLEKWGAVLVSGQDHYGRNRFRTQDQRGNPFKVCD